MGTFARFAVRFIGALVTGVATLFTMKTDPTEHWSIPPTVTLRVDARVGVPGTPGSP